MEEDQFEKLWSNDLNDLPDLKPNAFIAGSQILEEFKPVHRNYCVLIDTNGNIVWTGHPEERDLKDDIHSLLNYEVLFGVVNDLKDEGTPRTFPNKTFSMQNEKMKSFSNICETALGKDQS